MSLEGPSSSGGLWLKRCSQRGLKVRTKLDKGTARTQTVVSLTHQVLAGDVVTLPHVVTVSFLEDAEAYVGTPPSVDLVTASLPS